LLDHFTHFHIGLFGLVIHQEQTILLAIEAECVCVPYCRPPRHLET
jgi:hypothetical protein